MNIKFLLSTSLLAGITIINSAAIAAPELAKPIVLIDNKTTGDDTTYMTTWTAYPIRNDYQLQIALYAEGKISSFEGLVSVDCEQPTHSRIDATNEHYSKSIDSSLKDAMANNVILTPAVKSVQLNLGDSNYAA